MLKRIFTLVIPFVVLGIAQAQTGPGGVGNSDGSGGQPRNVLWLDASSLGLSDGGNVATWTDNSGNAYDASQSTGGSQPVFVEQYAAINNKSLVEFDGSSQFMWLPTEITTTDNGIVGDDFACVMVAGRTTTSTEWFMGGNGNGPSGGNLHVGWRDGNTFAFGFWGNDVDGDPSPTPAANTLQITYMDLNRSANPARRLYQDGDLLNTRTSTSTLSEWDSPTIGRRSGSVYGDLLLAELIFYKGELNHVQRVLIDNYLAEKYDLSITNDFYTNSAYQGNLTGIGQEESETLSSSSSAGFYIIENGGLDTDGEFVFFAHEGTENGVSTANLPTGVVERWARDWYVENTTGFDVKVIFDLPEGIEGEFPKEITNYRLLYKANVGDDYQVVSSVTAEYGDNDQVAFPISSGDLANGYYTLGTVDNSASPVEGLPGVTYYTLASGNWTDSDIWTLDPSGALPNNPSSTYPQLENDIVVIKNGKTVTMNTDNINCASLTVEGRLDLQASSGHEFDVIKGDGRILMQDDNFPTGDATHFVTEGQGEGTVEFNGGDIILSNGREFYDVEINQNTSSNTITMMNDLDINGNLTIITGGLKINDDDAGSTTILNLTVDGDVEVQSNGSVSVGEGSTIGSYSIGGTMPAVGEYHNIFHQFTVGGSFTNRGTVRLTNQDAPVYNQFTGNGGVTLRFTGATNEKFYCYNTTDLYNLVVEKGTDRTYLLELYADNADYFRLFGPVNYGRTGSSPFSDADPEVRKALWIHKGTLKLTGSVYIPTLSETSVGGGNGDYAVGFNAKLWIAGDDVVVYSTAYDVDDIPGFTSTDTYQAVGVSTSTSNSAMSLYGEFQIDGGLFDTGNSYGFVFWPQANPTAVINGGTVNLYKLYQSGAGTATYKQTGGTLNILGGTGDHFDLSSEDAVFQMSGGTIEIQTGNFYVGAKEGNYNVTGGTLLFKQNGGRTPVLSSTAPIYDLEVESLNEASGLTVNLQSELTVLNDLTLNTPEGVVTNTTRDFLIFLHNGNDVSIGRNFRIERGARYEWGEESGNNWDAGWTTNTTTFNGTEDGEFYFTWHNNPNDGEEQNFWNFVVNKPSDKKLTLTSDETTKNMTGVDNRLIKTHGELRVESGMLDQGNLAIRAYGNVVNKGVLTTYEHGVTGDEANIRLRPGNYSVETTDGAEFGQVKFNPGNTSVISLTSDVYIKRINYHNGRLYIGTNNLKLDHLYNKNTDSTYEFGKGSVQEMIVTDGNASDGGLSVNIYGNRTYYFPLGIGTDGVDVGSGGNSKYTPAEVKVTDYSDDGYITVTPVDGELKTTDLTGGNLLNYYWRVNHDGFSVLPTVKYRFRFNNDDVVGDVDDYVPGKVLDESPYTRSYENRVQNVETDNDILFVDRRTTTGGSQVSNTQAGFTLEKANYTAGESGRFEGTVDEYFTNAWYQNWNTGSIWHKGSKTGTTGEVPTEGSIVHIYRDGANQGRIWGNGLTNSPAEIIFEHNYSVYPEPDPENMPRLQFRTSGSFTLGKVSGTGMISLRNDVSPTINGDWGEFADNPDAIVMCWGGNTTLTNIMQPAPSLMIEGSRVSIDQEIELQANLILTGNTDLTLLQDVHIMGDLYVGGWSGGQLFFPNSGSPVEVAVDGNIDYTYIHENGDRDIFVNNSGNEITHKLILKGDIIQGNNNGYSLDLYNGSGRPNVELELQGESDNSYSRTSNNVPQLYRLILNKGNSQVNSFTFNQNVTLQGTTSGVDVDKALELQNGTLILDHADIDIDLTTGDNNFSIPSTTALEVKQGTVNASGDSGIDLDGLLKVSGGTVDMSGGDNPIVYSASGNAQINVESGILTVGSQIRRDTRTDDGALQYYQSGGTVIVGETNAPTASRGVFEIRGTGSHFEHTGGTLQIANGQPSASVAALYLTPETSNVGSGTTITFDPVQSSGISEIGVYTTIPLKNILLKDDANLTVKQWTVPLTVEENFEIEQNAAFNANGQDLLIAGDFTLGGTFSHGNNTTTFNGGAEQTVNGDVTFYNLTKTGTNTLSLNSGNTELNVENELDFQGGTLNDNSNNVYVQGYCAFAGTHVYGGSGKGIVLNGTSTQELYGGGVLGMLTINNAAGIDVPLGNEFTINNKLRLEAGIFNIDKNLLLLTEDCIIEHGADDFSKTNMIQTNISFTDNGVRKIFPVVDRGSDPVYNFTYPMGSGGKYTPVTVALTNNDDNTGSLTVKPANEYHPSVIDPNNVLQYYWELKASGMLDFEAEVRFKYDPADIYVETPNDIDDYYTARLLSDGTGDWNKFSGADVIDDATHELVFDFTGTNDAGISGAYTAGLNEAIPDQVPGYITIKDGDWTDETIWDTYPTSGGTVPAGGPRGSLVYISHDVDVPSNFLSVYRTAINAGGILNIGSTFGHRVGDVSGTGTLVLSDQGSLPAGVYDAFFASTGGTLEFTGSTDFDFLSDINSLNNLVLSGAGERRFPNLDLTILGDLTITGDDAINIVDVINEHDKNLCIEGDLIFNDYSTYDAGTGTSTISFTGSALQDIRGASSFESSNSFNHFRVNNPIGIDVNTDISIANLMYIDNGVVYNNNGKDFTVANSDENAIIGVTESKYIEGPLRKLINNGGQYDFPLGDNGRLGNVLVTNTSTGAAAYWEAEYYNYNPDNDSYDVASMDGGVQYVSHNEYWRVEAPASGNSANLTLRWDGASGVTPDNNFRVVKWTDLATDAWQDVDITNKGTSSSSGTVELLNDLTFGFDGSNNNHYITFGSISIPAYTWIGNTNDWFTASNWSNTVVPGASASVTINTVAADKLYPVIDPSVSTDVVNVNDLSIASGASLTLVAGAKMSINGNLTTNDGLVVNNTAESPSSVIAYGTVNGDATYNWPLTERVWWYIAHPVTGVSESEYDTSVGADEYALNIYNGGWSRIAGTGDIAPSTPYTFDKPAEGYSLILRNAGETLSYSGVLNSSATYTSGNMDKRYHLVANPYPSYIDVDHSGFNIGSLRKTIYIRKSNNEVSTYNLETKEGLLGGSRYISPGQCMWLYSAAANGSMSISSSARTHTTGGYGLKSASSRSDDRIRLKLEGVKGSDEAVVIFNENGSELYTSFDSEKVMNGGKLASLYSIKDNRSVAINSMPELSSTDIVPLGYNVAESGMGDFTISVTNIDDFMPETDVYLYDKDLDITINLRDERWYTFTTATAQANDRFELRFESSVTTDTDDGQTVSKRNVLIYAAKQKATVRVTEEILQAKNRLIEVYSVTGQLVTQHDLNDTETTFELPQANAIYIIKVSVDNSAYQQKVVSMQ